MRRNLVNVGSGDDMLQRNPYLASEDTVALVADVESCLSSSRQL